MTTRRTNDSDAQLGLELLALVPHAPNETEESLRELFGRGWSYSNGGSILVLSPQLERKHMEIAWWLPLSAWLGEGLDLLIDGLSGDVATRLSLTARDQQVWTAGGLFSAPGDTAEERLRNSEAIANIHKQWLPTVKVERDCCADYYRADDTFANIIRAGRAWRGA